MPKEVNYKMGLGLLTNEIYCGLQTKSKDGTCWWKTRANVTKEATHCVIEHFIKLNEERNSNNEHKGTSWKFPHDSLDIELIIKNKESKK